MGLQRGVRSVRRYGALLVVGAASAFLLGCGSQAQPTTPAGDRIIGVSANMGFIHVVKAGRDGTLTVCTYYSDMRPGETYQPRGCQVLPPQ